MEEKTEAEAEAGVGRVGRHHGALNRVGLGELEGEAMFPYRVKDESDF